MCEKRNGYVHFGWPFGSHGCVKSLLVSLSVPRSARVLEGVTHRVDELQTCSAQSFSSCFAPIHPPGPCWRVSLQSREPDKECCVHLLAGLAGQQEGGELVL